MNIRRLEHLLLAFGLVLLAIWCAVRLYQPIESRAAINQFRAEEAIKLNQNINSFSDTSSDSIVDVRLWSTKRMEAYGVSFSQVVEAPLAILRIPRIELEVPVFNGTDDLTLNRGVGRIVGTAKIGEIGNLGIAGHRDGFFRGLKDLELGDVVEVNRPGQSDKYFVRQARIVEPDDVSVLASTPQSTLTLVTCFPFYYIGSAPKRYVITASIQNVNLRN